MSALHGENVFRNLGCAMEIMTVVRRRMRRLAVGVVFFSFCKTSHTSTDNTTRRLNSRPFIVRSSSGECVTRPVMSVLSVVIR